MRTVKLADGKYEVDIDERGLIVNMRRNGEHWPAGFADLRFSNVFGAAMSRIAELEDEARKVQS